MKTVSLVGSISRRAGGLFESVRRLDQELGRIPSTKVGKDVDPSSVRRSRNMEVSVLGTHDECTAQDYASWFSVPVQTFRCRGPRCFGYRPRLARELRRLRPELGPVHG